MPIFGSVQTTYGLVTGLAYAGQPADSGYQSWNTFNNADVVSIPFGVAVKRSTISSSNGALVMAAQLPTTNADEIVGITGRELWRENQSVINTNLGNFYAVNEPMNVMRRAPGRIYVIPEVNVTAGQPVFYRYSVNGSLTQLGALRNDADTSHAAQIVGAVWDTTTTAGLPAIVKFYS